MPAHSHKRLKNLLAISGMHLVLRGSPKCPKFRSLHPSISEALESRHMASGTQRQEPQSLKFLRVDGMSSLGNLEAEENPSSNVGLKLQWHPPDTS